MDFRPIRVFLCMDFKDQRLHLEAVGSLIAAEILIHCVPFRWLRGLLISDLNSEKTHGVPLRESEVWLVSEAVRRVGRRSPLSFVCLPRAIAVKWMLNRRGYGSCLCFGVKTSDRGLEAHAWLEVDGVTVIGGKDRSAYTEITRVL